MYVLESSHSYVNLVPIRVQNALLRIIIILNDHKIEEWNLFSKQKKVIWMEINLCSKRVNIRMSLKPT